MDKLRIKYNTLMTEKIFSRPDRYQECAECPVANGAQMSKAAAQSNGVTISCTVVPKPISWRLWEIGQKDVVMTAVTWAIDPETESSIPHPKKRIVTDSCKGYKNRNK